ELLFKAYFSEGKNIDDAQTLILMAIELGLDTNELAQDMNSGAYTDAVIADVNEAQQLGVRGVPFFVFNRKYAISGAQGSDVFLDTLKKSFDEWKAANPKNNFKTIDGQNCTDRKSTRLNSSHVKIS